MPMLANIIRPNNEATVQEIVNAAARIVVAAELTDELRGLAFAEAVRLLGATVVVPAPTPEPPLSLGRLGLAG